MSKKIVAFQGEAGAYSEAAAYHYFGAETQTLPCKSFDELFAAVSEGRATHAHARRHRRGLRRGAQLELRAEHEATLVELAEEQARHFARLRAARLAQTGR